jgi:hypothetical protein
LGQTDAARRNDQGQQHDRSLGVLSAVEGSAEKLKFSGRNFEAGDAQVFDSIEPLLFLQRLSI